MTNEEIREARRKLGLTQEALAEMMMVDVTTVQRWEAGATEPGLTALQRLQNLFQKRPGLRHPLLDFFLSLSVPVGVLDEHAVYRRVNRPFVEFLGFGDRAEVLGHYCTEVCGIWQSEEYARVYLEPPALLFSNFESLSIQENQVFRGARKQFVHTITAVRQREFSSLLLHTIEEETLT